MSHASAFPAPARATAAVAARATDLSKVYGQGETRVVALDSVSVEFGKARRIVEALHEPTADTVLDRMRLFDSKGRTS